MQIGTLKLDVPLLLAPMAGITDLPFRVICRELGCGMTVSEMVSAKGLLYKNVKTFDMLRIDPGERPTAIQLFGSVPAELAEAARIVAGNGADVIDFNMGCPVPKVVNNGEGSALMKNPQLAYEILARMTDAVSVPVTVKFRAGWDSEHINAEEIAVLAEKAGVAAVAVHGRTREQFYSGNADWNVIKKVKENVGIPVVGNGDVEKRDDYLRMKETTGCDGVMVGRAALGMPFIFEKLQDKEYEFDVKAAILKHIEILGEYLPERTVINQMKAQLCFYAKNTRHAKDVRRAISELRTRDDLMRIIDEFF